MYAGLARSGNVVGNEKHLGDAFGGPCDRRVARDGDGRTRTCVGQRLCRYLPTRSIHKGLALFNKSFSLLAYNRRARTNLFMVKRQGEMV